MHPELEDSVCVGYRERGAVETLCPGIKGGAFECVQHHELHLFERPNEGQAFDRRLDQKYRTHIVIVTKLSLSKLRQNGSAYLGGGKHYT